jgi:hypothetical protein
VINQMNLRTVRSAEEALGLLRLLGYDSAAARPFDLSEVGLAGVGRRLRSERSPARGYGVLVAEVPEMPRSLKTFGRRLVEELHDRPLALLGVTGNGGWREWAVVRPQLVRGGGGAVSIAKLQVDPGAPTSHDVEVIGRLAWSAAKDDERNHAAIDAALDVERVTRRFFVELNRHYARLVEAVEMHAGRDAAVRSGVDHADGAARVALRIVTQTLFCYFLQRKALLEGDRSWLSNAFRRTLAEGGFYPRVMEPLFYEALSSPLERRPEEWLRPGLPFLNGGLFERHYGDVSLPLEDSLFSTEEGLLGFLDGWTFTVAEDTADEAEVAVDPEMLGKVFENLIADDDRKAQGTIYTPRPVVQFMCREALVPYLQRAAGIGEPRARTLIAADDPFAALSESEGTAETVRLATAVESSLAEIRVLDPAVGSGAFPLGMLAEILRLRRLAHAVTEGREPTDAELGAWKLHAIEHCLFGVDINPTAIELCRLRLWLSLLVEAPAGRTPDPLPNLEYRTVCADSLTDFVAGVEVQNTRGGLATLGFDEIDPNALVELRDRYFVASDPEEKSELRRLLATAEDDLVESIFARARARAEAAARASRAATRKVGESAAAGVTDLAARYRTRDRVYPVFLPAFLAPDVAERGGWDVVIMNPPYVGRKEVPRRLGAARTADLERHYGRTSDLMIHFALRALELARPGGAVSMIFNDSIFTSTDADDLRRTLVADTGKPVTLHAAARTRCFEGVAVNGGVVVATRASAPDPEVRWVENHGRDPRELLAASLVAGGPGTVVSVGDSELFEVEDRHYRRLPHRPLFRPSEPAVALLDAFERCAGWRELSRFSSPDGSADWRMLSETPRLERWLQQSRVTGFFERLEPGRDFVLLGLVVRGGQGLATADDRRFLAAIDGTVEADRASERLDVLEQAVLARPEPAAAYYQALDRDPDRAGALLQVALRFRDKALGWPKGGLIRVAPAEDVRRTRLKKEEVRSGITEGPIWVPFEKGDSSEAGAAAWRRDNPLVIDWSPTSVSLLRRRAAGKESYRKPYFRNEDLWGQGGVTWNAISSYLRGRLVREGGIFGHGAPVIRPTIPWLSTESLLTLLNSPMLDFALRTFLASRMNTHVGDIRRLPIPVLDTSQAADLTDLGRRAIDAKRAKDEGKSEGGGLTEIEAELDAYVRDLYGVRRDADLWVVR